MPDAIEILQNTVGTEPFGTLAQTVLDLISKDRAESGTEPNFTGPSSPSPSSLEIAKTWSIKSGLPKFPTEKWDGIEQSIASLRAKATPVSLIVIETGSAMVSLWFSVDGEETRALMMATLDPGKAPQSKLSPL